jgi:hypothetical protein
MRIDKDVLAVSLRRLTDRAHPDANLRAALQEVTEAGVHLFGVRGSGIMLAGVIVGTLDVYKDHPAEWDESEPAALNRFSNIVGMLLSSALSAHEAAELATQLQYALDYRVVIERGVRGVGYLMARDGVDAVVAFNRLRRAARSTQTRPGMSPATCWTPVGCRPKATSAGPRGPDDRHTGRQAAKSSRPEGRAASPFEPEGLSRALTTRPLGLSTRSAPDQAKGNLSRSAPITPSAEPRAGRRCHRSAEAVPSTMPGASGRLDSRRPAVGAPIACCRYSRGACWEEIHE